MDLVFDIALSMEFWRRVYPVDRALSQPGDSVPGSCVHTWGDAQELLPNWVNPSLLERFDGKVHLLSFDKSARGKSECHETHVWSGPIPRGSFYRLSDKVYVASPAFVFLGAASLLDKHALIAFGCELCGFYMFDESNRRGFRKRKTPLTTVDQLQDYLSNAKGCRGYRKAMAALPHIISGSASPMETFDVMALCLPPRLGGYSFPRPSMNYEVTLSPKAARIANREKCFADMFYCRPNVMLDIEHHGRYDHSDPDDVASDRARVNGLKEMGFEVIELTKEQVKDPVVFEYIVTRIAKLIGVRIRKQHLGSTPERMEMRSHVFAWNKSSGKLR